MTAHNWEISVRLVLNVHTCPLVLELGPRHLSIHHYQLDLFRCAVVIRFLSLVASFCCLSVTLARNSYVISWPSQQLSWKASSSRCRCFSYYIFCLCLVLLGQSLPLLSPTTLRQLGGSHMRGPHKVVQRGSRMPGSHKVVNPGQSNSHMPGPHKVVSPAQSTSHLPGRPQGCESWATVLRPSQ